ncbi:hypothetical protein Tco_1307315, partial [Tanacetum coccineum]
HPSDTEVFTVKMEILLVPTSNKLLVEVLVTRTCKHGEPNTFVLKDPTLQVGNPVKENTLTNYAKMENDYIDEYSENLVLKVVLAKKKQMVEKKNLDEVSFPNNKYFNNQNAPEILEFFKINEWQAKLDAKDVSIANLKKHIESLKGKRVVENDATPNKAKVIAPGMFKIDLEPPAPKVLNNKDANIYYIKHSQEHAGTLWEIVEHARALRPLDSDFVDPNEQILNSLA